MTECVRIRLQTLNYFCFEFPKVITFLDVFNNLAEFAETWLNISDAIKEEIREVITNRTADDNGYDSQVSH